jgi:hypothetical protein
MINEMQLDQEFKDILDRYTPMMLIELVLDNFLQAIKPFFLDEEQKLELCNLAQQSILLWCKQESKDYYTMFEQEQESVLRAVALFFEACIMFGIQNANFRLRGKVLGVKKPRTETRGIMQYKKDL